MQEITQEQSARLQSFAEQRDVLQKEVTELTRERDMLLAVNLERTTTNSQLETEIGERQAILATFSNSIIDEINGVSRELVKANKELAEIQAKKEVAERELEVATSQLKKIVEIVNSIHDGVEQTHTSLRGVNSQVNIFIDSIKNAAGVIVSHLNGVKASSDKFADSISKQYEKVTKRETTLDKRELYLNDRETAINELVSDYKKALNNRK